MRSVDRWEVNGEEAKRRILEMLDRAETYEGDVYSKVEQDPRNKGEREPAEVVHRAMKRKVQWILWPLLLASLLRALLPRHEQ